MGTGLAARYPQAQVREMQGRLVMPGIVCSHNHFYSGLARGIMANIKPCPDFISTLKNLWWRLDRALDEESLYYSGLVCSLEAIKSGCTAVIDHHASPNYVGRVARAPCAEASSKPGFAASPATRPRTAMAGTQS